MRPASYAKATSRAFRNFRFAKSGLFTTSGSGSAPREYRRRTRIYDWIGYHPLFDLSTEVVVDGLIGRNESLFIKCSSEAELTTNQPGGNASTPAHTLRQ
jgi:hypothetical protein